MRISVFQDPEIKVNAIDAWKQLKVSLIVPILYSTFIVCVLIFCVLFIERLYMIVMVLCLKAFGRKTYTKDELDAVRQTMERNKEHPTVLIQIPVYNDSEDFNVSIAAACMLKWPKERLIVQVLDNTTNLAMKAHVKAECGYWEFVHMNIKYEERIISGNGYQEGALQEGLQQQYVNDCEHVVILNPYFQLPNDFLIKTIPFHTENNNLGMVQARWTSVDECIMKCCLPEISLSYHFRVEQQVDSSARLPFGIDDTIGWWGIEAIIDAGGWKERSTVDNMDLIARSNLQGWKYISMRDVC